MKKLSFSLTQLKPRERLLGSIAGVILLSVALDRLVLNPWLRHVRAIQQEAREMERRLLQHQRLLTRRVHVDAERAHLEIYLRPALADDLQMAALLKEVEGLAAESRVQIVEIKPQGIDSNDRVRRYTLDVRCAGALSDWVGFVYSLETSPSLFEIARASLAVPEDAPDQLESTLRVVASLVAPQAQQPPPEPEEDS